MAAKKLGKTISRPKISVVVPTYKRLNYLKIAVAGILHQTYANYEVIISDNADEEQVGAYIASLKDVRFSYYSNKVNLGLFQNLNSAILKCKGDIVVFLEDDCRWPDPDFLKKVADTFARHPGCPLALCRRFRLIDSAGREGYERMAGVLPRLRNPLEDDGFIETGPDGTKYVPKERMQDALTHRNIIFSPMLCCARRTLYEIGLYDPSASMSADWLNCLKLSLLHDFPVFDSTVDYRIHGSSTTSALLGRDQLMLTALEFASTYFKFAEFCRRHNRPGAAGRLKCGISEKGAIFFLKNLRAGFSLKTAFACLLLFTLFSPLRASYNQVRDRYRRTYRK